MTSEGQSTTTERRKAPERRSARSAATAVDDRPRRRCDDLRAASEGPRAAARHAHTDLAQTRPVSVGPGRGRRRGAVVQGAVRAPRIVAAGLPVAGIGPMPRPGRRPRARAVRWVRPSATRSTLEPEAPEVIVMTHDRSGMACRAGVRGGRAAHARGRAGAAARRERGTGPRTRQPAPRPTRISRGSARRSPARARSTNSAMQLLTKAHDEIDEASGRTSHPITERR